MQLVAKANRVTASACLVAVIKAVPYKIHTILTVNGIRFRYPPSDADSPTANYMSHSFAMRRLENGIEHRFTKINYPWTNGQVERMNRTIKEATIKHYHCDDHAKLERYLADFIAAYVFGRRNKTLNGLGPCEFMGKCWTSGSHSFGLNPIHDMLGMNASFPSVPK